MKKILVFLFYFGVLQVSFSQTQSEMNMEANESLAVADAELNRVYQEILMKYKSAPEFLAKLKASQRLWIQFRDAEVEMKYPNPDIRHFGSVYPVCVVSMLKEMTVERSEKLKEWLEPVKEGDVCIGSVNSY